MSNGRTLDVQAYLELLNLEGRYAKCWDRADTEGWASVRRRRRVRDNAHRRPRAGRGARPQQSVVPSFRILGVRTLGAYALAIGAMIFRYVALRYFMRRTFVGPAISALSQDFDAARAVGLPVRRLQLMAFAISGLLVGTAGFLVAPVISISSDAGLRYVLNGPVAVVVDGIGSNLGTLIGGHWSAWRPC